MIFKRYSRDIPMIFPWEDIEGNIMGVIKIFMVIKIVGYIPMIIGLV
jgi:hypothetical protein